LYGQKTSVRVSS